MPKKRKISKKKVQSISSTEPITSICNVSGLQDEINPFSEANDSTNELDDCLALMDQSYQTEMENDKSLNDDGESEEISKSPIVDSGSSVQNKLWKGPGQSSSFRSSKPAPVDFPMPNISSELARHKHMGELSKYLLSTCHHLRMPAFERWVIDSKMEERSKRKSIKEHAEILTSQEQHEQNASNGRLGKEAKWKSRQKRKQQMKKTSLENHLTTSGQRPANDYDPVIPSMADVEDEASQRLMKEIERGNDNEGESKLDAMQIVRTLCKDSCEASRHVQNLNSHLGEVNSRAYFGKNRTCGRISLETTCENNVIGAEASNGESSTFSLVYSHKRKSKSDGAKAGKPFVVKINAQHYEKLRNMFHSIHDRAGSAKPMHISTPSSLGTNPRNYSPATNIFHHLLFCILLRYASLSGAQQLVDKRGGGMQGAIHAEVFDCLARYQKNNQDAIMECFASPLNVYSGRYFSIFHKDLDWHFGSSGDFFSIPVGYFGKGGIQEANPPFTPGLMEAMTERMEDHLTYADSVSEKKGEQCPLSFVIVVPSCSSNGSDVNIVQKFASKSFRAMLRSKFFSKQIVLSSREHGYIEGSQHLKPTRFKDSQYATSVIILQSRDAKEQEKVSKTLTSEEFESRIREAFVSRHQSEIEERRKETDEPDIDDKVEVSTHEVEVDKKKRKKKSGKKRKRK